MITLPVIAINSEYLYPITTLTIPRIDYVLMCASYFQYPHDKFFHNICQYAGQKVSYGYLRSLMDEWWTGFEPRCPVNVVRFFLGCCAGCARMQKKQ